MADPADWGLTREQAAEMIRAQICPVCRRGPWKIPLGHVSRMHGIDAFAMRDACGLTVTESVTDEETHRTFAEKPRDMTAVTEASRTRGKQRWTTAGREKASAPLLRWVAENPDAAAEQLARAQSAGGQVRAAQTRKR